MNKYQQGKARARETAQEWQQLFPEKNYCYLDLLNFSNYFFKIAKRYGLIKEFKENCII